MDRRPLLGALAATLVALAARPALAHVDYVTDDAPSGEPIAFLATVLAEPVNAALLAGGGLAVVAAVGVFRWQRPAEADLQELLAALDAYEDLVPWMLRLSLGLPLVGAGFAGYLFAPTVTFDPAARPLARVALVGVGFGLLFGLGTRFLASVGLGLYLLVLVTAPEAVLAAEYVPAFLAIVVLGPGRPSADHMLRSVAEAPGTWYGRVDPVHRLEAWTDEATAPFVPYVPTLLRVGVGLVFVYLGAVQKLGQPGSGLAVVAKYDLTSVVPVDPALWVVGAGLAEIAVGVALVAGAYTRASAATAFLLFTLTLFGLPDDPVLAHITLFGLASAIVTLGSGPLAVDRWLAARE